MTGPAEAERRPVRRRDLVAALSRACVAIGTTASIAAAILIVQAPQTVGAAVGTTFPTTTTSPFAPVTASARRSVPPTTTTTTEASTTTTEAAPTTQPPTTSAPATPRSASTKRAPGPTTTARPPTTAPSTTTAAPVTTTAPAPAPAGDPYVTSVRAAVLSQTNDDRARRGHGTLAVDAWLQDRAQAWADELAAESRYAHAPSGYYADWSRFQAYAENVGGAGDPRAVYLAWFDSDRHRANMLNQGYDRIGVGVACRSGTLYLVAAYAATSGHPHPVADSVPHDPPSTATIEALTCR